MALAKECAISASVYRVPDRIERYLKFVSQLVCLAASLLTNRELIWQTGLNRSNCTSANR